jgi:hypothetical protein
MFSCLYIRTILIAVQWPSAEELKGAFFSDIHADMTKLEKIETAIEELSPDELQQLASWFAEYHADAWDKQIEADVASGRLDGLAEKALAHHRAGRTSPL